MKTAETTNSEEKKVTVFDKIKKVLIKILDAVMPCIIVCLFLVFCNTFLARFVLVSGSSMASTLHNKDCLIVNELLYRTGDPKRFDVIVFENSDDVYYIKRIIGLPGETVQITDDGEIRINGEVLNEDYGAEVMISSGIAAEPITLGDNEYFVLGDNRNNSEDSRFESVGPISRDQIFGKAWLRIAPFNEFELVDNL